MVCWRSTLADRVAMVSGGVEAVMCEIMRALFEVWNVWGVPAHGE